MDINDIPFIELDLDIDYSKLLSESLKGMNLRDINLIIFR